MKGPDDLLVATASALDTAATYRKHAFAWLIAFDLEAALSAEIATRVPAARIHRKLSAKTAGSMFYEDRSLFRPRARRVVRTATCAVRSNASGVDRPSGRLKKSCRQATPATNWQRGLQGGFRKPDPTGSGPLLLRSLLLFAFRQQHERGFEVDFLFAEQRQPMAGLDEH